MNGTLTGHVPIHSALRQACPLSVVLYALCLHPLLRTLENRLPKFHIGSTARSSPVLAYAVDVTVLVTKPDDFETIHQSVRHYERATGTRLNKSKSKVLAIGNWSAPVSALGIEFQEQIMILGVQFASTIG